MVRKKAYTVAKELGLNREDRIELALMVLPISECKSWDDLDDHDMSRLLDALTGFVYVATLRSHHSP